MEVGGTFDFLGVAGNRRFARVLYAFKLLAYLGARAYTRGLYTYNLSLLGISSYLIATAFYKVSIRFPFRLS